MTEMTERFIITVVAHIDHGKTSLIDSLLAGVHAIPASVAGQLRFMDTRDDELIRGITLKLSSTKLIYNKACFYVIDTPGHVDFEALVQTSAVLADYAALIVDVNEGITPRLFSIVSHIRNKHCVLVLNKIDKLFDTSEDVPNALQHIICQINGLFKSEKFSWESNNVILACAIQCSGLNHQKMCELMKNDSKRTNLRSAVKFWMFLNEKIVTKNTKDIAKRFNIKPFTDKDIWMGVIPLSEVFYASFLSLKNIFSSGNNDLNLQLLPTLQSGIYENCMGQTQLREKYMKAMEEIENEVSVPSLSDRITSDSNMKKFDENNHFVSEFKNSSVHFNDLKHYSDSLITNRCTENICPNGSFIESNPIDIYKEDSAIVNRRRNLSSAIKNIKSAQLNTTHNNIPHNEYESDSHDKADEISPIKPYKQINNSNHKIYKEDADPDLYNTSGCIINLKEKDRTILKEELVLATVGFSVLRYKNRYTSDNLLFAVKLTQGTINKGDILLNIGSNDTQLIEIYGIYDLMNATFIEKKDAVAGELIYINADLRKSSYLTNTNHFEYYWPQQIKPFYKSWIALKDESNQSRMKESLKLLSFLESTFSTRINQYSEFEIMCEGKVQFEKICTDLKNMGNDFHILDFKEPWAETITTEHSIEVSTDNYKFNMRMTPIDRNHFYEDKFINTSLNAFTECSILTSESHTSEIELNHNNDQCIPEISKLSLDNTVSCSFITPDGNHTPSNAKSEHNVHDLKNTPESHTDNSHDNGEFLDTDMLEFKNPSFAQVGYSSKAFTISEAAKNDNVSLSDSHNTQGSSQILHDEYRENIFIIHANRYINTVKDAYNTFVNNGPLTESNVKYTKLHLNIETSSDLETQDVFNLIKDQLCCLFQKCSPQLIPFYYKCKIQLLTDYIGIIYQLLNRYKHKFQSEIYDTTTDFHIIETLVPQFLYYTFLDEARKLSSGTVYIEIEEYGFERSSQFSDHIIRVRKMRGLEVDEVLVENPDKQRTLKK